MDIRNQKEIIEFNTTDGICPVGETVGKRNIKESKIPVLSCEGACIRGEIYAGRVSTHNAGRHTSNPPPRRGSRFLPDQKVPEAHGHD